jgi:hypothetical protein
VRKPKVYITFISGDEALVNQIAETRRDIEANPNNAGLRHSLGTCLYLLGQKAEGLEQFDLCIKIGGDSWRSLVERTMQRLITESDQ